MGKWKLVLRPNILRGHSNGNVATCENKVSISINQKISVNLVSLQYYRALRQKLHSFLKRFFV